MKHHLTQKSARKPSVAFVERLFDDSLQDSTILLPLTHIFHFHCPEILLISFHFFIVHTVSWISFFGQSWAHNRSVLNLKNLVYSRQAVFDNQWIENVLSHSYPHILALANSRNEVLSKELQDFRLNMSV